MAQTARPSSRARVDALLRRVVRTDRALLRALTRSPRALACALGLVEDAGSALGRLLPGHDGPRRAQALAEPQVREAKICARGAYIALRGQRLGRGAA